MVKGECHLAAGSFPHKYPSLPLHRHDTSDCESVIGRVARVDLVFLGGRVGGSGQEDRGKRSMSDCLLRRSFQRRQRLVYELAGGLNKISECTIETDGQTIKCLIYFLNYLRTYSDLLTVTFILIITI